LIEQATQNWWLHGVFDDPREIDDLADFYAGNFALAPPAVAKERPAGIWLDAPGG
jgi:hypothetical protein